MQGIWLELRSGGARRPTSKKEVRDALGWAPSVTIVVEATSMHGSEFSGPADMMLPGERVYFVGPDPYTSRRFYGTIERDKLGRLTVK